MGCHLFITSYEMTNYFFYFSYFLLAFLFLPQVELYKKFISIWHSRRLISDNLHFCANSYFHLNIFAYETKTKKTWLKHKLPTYSYAKLTKIYEYIRLSTHFIKDLYSYRNANTLTHTHTKRYTYICFTCI